LSLSTIYSVIRIFLGLPLLTDTEAAKDSDKNNRLWCRPSVFDSKSCTSQW